MLINYFDCFLFIIIEEMNQQKYANRLNFETSKHHKQILRQQIDENMINQIEIDKNPSLNYMNAYKNLYHDQLQKTVQEHEEKKLKEKIVSDEDRFLYKNGMKNQKPADHNVIGNMTSSMIQRGNGKRYVDYDEERTMKFQDHVRKNYDGGQAFFKAHDEHLMKKMNEANMTNSTLKTQLKWKEYQKQLEDQKRLQQNQAFKELKYKQWQVDQQKLIVQAQNQGNFRNQIVNQMELQRQKKQRKSIFNYQNIARHNPITNPIEYHIDNPYILKEIQNRNAYKNSSVPTRPY